MWLWIYFSVLGLEGLGVRGEQDLALGKGVLAVRGGVCTGGRPPRDATRRPTRARGRRCNPGKPPPASPFGFQAGEKKKNHQPNQTLIRRLIPLTPSHVPV